MGGQPRRSAVRRHGIHGRVRDRTPVPRHADPGHRRRHHRDPDLACRQAPGLPVMSALRATLDPKGDTYTAAASAAETRLEEIEAELAKALGGGGAKYVERHHDRGKLTARERIELLVDADAPFLELTPLAAYGSAFQVGASLVTGIGPVNGVECMIVANDPTVKGGTSNPWTFKKVLRANAMALQNRLPVIS